MSAIEILQVVSIVSAAVSVVIAAASFVVSSRKSDQQRQTEIETRQQQLVMQVLTELKTSEFIETWGTVMYHMDWTDTADFLRKYSAVQDPKGYGRFWNLIYSYQTLGYFLKKGLIDMETVVTLQAPVGVTRLYEKLQPFLEGFHERYNTQVPDAFGYLAQECEKYMKEHPYKQTAQSFTRRE